MSQKVTEAAQRTVAGAGAAGMPERTPEGMPEGTQTPEAAQRPEETQTTAAAEAA